MRTKKFAPLFAVLSILSLLLAACGGQTAPTQAAAAACPLKVGYVSDVGKINDQSFNQDRAHKALSGRTAQGHPARLPRSQEHDFWQES